MRPGGQWHRNITDCAGEGSKDHLFQYCQMLADDNNIDRYCLYLDQCDATTEKARKCVDCTGNDKTEYDDQTGKEGGKETDHLRRVSQIFRHARGWVEEGMM
jgi:hypothetical protein